jgi:hypothetical protein
MVGPVRFELTTPRLSSVCSDQLSYEPEFRFHSRKGCEDGAEPCFEGLSDRLRVSESLRDILERR